MPSNDEWKGNDSKPNFFEVFDDRALHVEFWNNAAVRHPAFDVCSALLSGHADDEDDGDEDERRSADHLICAQQFNWTKGQSRNISFDVLDCIPVSENRCIQLPLKVEYLDERRGVFSEASGLLTGGELLQAVTHVNSPGLAESPILYTFFDFNGVMGVEISSDQLRAAAELSIRGSRHQSVGRIVAIYAKDDFPFALARMWQVFVEQTGWETRVFRERSDAQTWIQSLAALRFGIQVLVQ